MMILVILLKLGLSSAQNLCYILTAEYFPIEYASSVFGYCNIAARFTTILAPLIAEMDPPMPLLIFSLINMLTLMFVEKLEKK